MDEDRDTGSRDLHDSDSEDDGLRRLRSNERNEKMAGVVNGHDETDVFNHGHFDM